MTLTPLALAADDILYFLHIPKTAGTTVRYLFQNRYAQAETCTDGYHIDQFLDLPPERLTNCKFLAGHLFYDVYQWLPRPPVFVTFLRHPVERFLSHYHHIRRFPNDPRFEAAHRLSAVDFARENATDGGIVNTATHLIGTAFKRDWLEQRYRTEGAVGFRVKPETAALALERLESFAFLGIAERFRESLHLLAYTLSLPPALQVTSHNVNHQRGRDELSQADFDAIAELNRYDMDLYAAGLALFERRSAAMMMQLLDESYERHAARFVQPVRKLDYCFDEGIDGVGWHEVERSRADEPFRWTGPGTESSLDVPLSAETDMEIEFHILQAIHPDVLRSLSLEVNGVPIRLTREQHSSGRGFLFKGCIPLGVIRNGRRFTRLLFRISETHLPNRPGVEDDRLLGVGFHRLKLTPVNA